MIVSLTFTVTSDVVDELLPSSDTPLAKCFGIDWVELCDDTWESGARMLVTEEACEGGTGGGCSGCCENCVRGIWESVGAGRVIGTSGTPARIHCTCILVCTNEIMHNTCIYTYVHVYTM